MREEYEHHMHANMRHARALEEHSRLCAPMLCALVDPTITTYVRPY